jgi:hypothetical protein
MLLSNFVRALAVLLSVAALTESKCSFSVMPGMSIDSKYSVRILTIATLKDCLDYLEDNSQQLAAIAFSDDTHYCCTVHNSVNYTLEHNYGWSTYFVGEVSSACDC